METPSQWNNEEFVEKSKMKKQVMPEAIKDLINSTSRTPKWALKIFQAIKITLPILEEGMEQTAIDVANRWLMENNPEHYEENTIEVETITIHQVLRELNFYSDKERMLDAAIAELLDIESKIERLRTLRPVVREIFQGLDTRIKEIFALHNELVRVDGVTTLDYGDNLGMYELDNCDAMRDDQAMAPAIEAYDLACEVNSIFL